MAHKPSLCVLCSEPAFTDPDPDFKGITLCPECLEAELEGDIDYLEGCLAAAKQRLAKFRKWQETTEDTDGPQETSVHEPSKAT